MILLGRSAFATAKLAASFRSRAARKCYWALVVGARNSKKAASTRRWPKWPGKMGDKVAVG